MTTTLTAKVAARFLMADELFCSPIGNLMVEVGQVLVVVEVLALTEGMVEIDARDGNGRPVGIRVHRDAWVELP